MRVQVAEGIHLNYVGEGSGDPPILIVAGPGVDNASSRPDTVKLFSTQNRTISYDTRGSGESDWSDWYSYKASCDDAAGLLKALKIDKAVIYGGSNGGILTLYFALYYPEMARALIVDASSSEVNFAAAKNWRKLAEKLLVAGEGATAELTGSAASAGNEFNVVRKMTPNKAPDARARFAMFYGVSDLYEHPLTPRLKEIRCPVLIMIGEEDKLVGVGGSVKMHRAIPGSQLRIVPGAGHTVLGTTPKVAQKEILNFIETL